MARVLEWDGENVPEEMLTLPPGRYVLQALDEGDALTDAEEQGLREALSALDAGRGASLNEVRERISRVTAKKP